MFNSGSNLTIKGQAFLTAIAVVLMVVIVSSLADMLVNALPVHLSQVAWRFGAAGSFLASLPQMATLMSLLVGVAVLNGARGTVRIVSGFALILAVVAVVIIFPFLLDFVQARRSVPVDNQFNFTLAALKTAGFGGLFALMFAWAGIRGWKASAAEAVVGARTRAAGLVIGQ